MMRPPGPEDFEAMKTYLEQELLHAPPCVAVSCEEGILFITTNRKTRLVRKVFEVHYRFAGAGIGSPASIERYSYFISTMADRAHYEQALFSAREFAGSISTTVQDIFRRGGGEPFKFVIARVGSVPEKDTLAEITCDGRYDVEDQFIVLGQKINGNGQRFAPYLASYSPDDRLDYEKNEAFIGALNEAYEAAFKKVAQDGSHLALRDALSIYFHEWKKSEGTRSSDIPIEAALLMRMPADAKGKRHYRTLSIEEAKRIISKKE